MNKRVKWINPPTAEEVKKILDGYKRSLKAKEERDEKKNGEPKDAA